MNLKLAENSVRFRLSDTDLNDFAAMGRIEECVGFGSEPDEQISYALERSGALEVFASVKNGSVTVFVPKDLAERWIESDLIGFETEQKLGDGRILRILVEKDLLRRFPKSG